MDWRTIQRNVRCQLVLYCCQWAIYPNTRAVPATWTTTSTIAITRRNASNNTATGDPSQAKRRAESGRPTSTFLLTRSFLCLSSNQCLTLFENPSTKPPVTSLTPQTPRTNQESRFDSENKINYLKKYKTYLNTRQTILELRFSNDCFCVTKQLSNRIELYFTGCLGLTMQPTWIYLQIVTTTSRIARVQLFFTYARVLSETSAALRWQLRSPSPWVLFYGGCSLSLDMRS